MTAPALITAQEYLVRIGDPLSELGRQLLATLLHYEAEVGRLTEKLREAEMRVFKFEEGEFVRVLKLEAQLARSAPFAALGRDYYRWREGGYRDGGLYMKTLNESYAAARAALSEEAEPEWSEPAPSGKVYRVVGEELHEAPRPALPHEAFWIVKQVPLSDVDFVAALLKGVTP